MTDQESRVRCTCQPNLGFNCKRCWSAEIADHGGWEEFHQKHHNWYMFDYHKSRRLKLLESYRRFVPQ